jgi:hypothetical protein
MQNARDTRAGNGSSDQFTLPDSFFQSDSLLRVLAAVRGAAIPQEARSEVRDLILSFAQTNDDAARTAIARAIAPYRDAFAPLFGTAPATSKAPETHAVIGMGRPRPTFGAPEPPPAAPQKPQPERTVRVQAVSDEPAAKPAPAPAPKPELKLESKPVPKPAPAGGSADPKTRIAEIKHTINERVGNPVNIIERNKAVGQEYMAALLDAIKRSSGQLGGVEEAMTRLEAAFTKVNELIASGEFEKPAPQETSAPVVPKPAVPAKAPAVPPKEEVVKPFADIVRKRPTPPPPPPMPVTEALEPVTPIRMPTTPPSTPPAPQDDEEVVSIAALRAKSPAAGEQSLMTPEIDAGLSQLLSEWKLFKSSGWFGAGPSGINHPLYKKLAHLPMAAVVAGRFEGSTPEIRQTIADYMNGWRYEQNIVHRMDEQFEHYLRRVIGHILKKHGKPSVAGT